MYADTQNTIFDQSNGGSPVRLEGKYKPDSNNKESTTKIYGEFFDGWQHIYSQDNSDSEERCAVLNYHFYDSVNGYNKEILGAAQFSKKYYYTGQKKKMKLNTQVNGFEEPDDIKEVLTFITNTCFTLYYKAPLGYMRLKPGSSSEYSRCEEVDEGALPYYAFGLWYTNTNEKMYFKKNYPLIK